VSEPGEIPDDRRADRGLVVHHEHCQRAVG
jgi:hypothetical protein